MIVITKGTISRLINIVAPQLVSLYADRQALSGENMAKVGSGAPPMRSHMRNWASDILPNL
jgi:hypothetical protein